jgi:hypothetical protein
MWWLSQKVAEKLRRASKYQHAFSHDLGGYEKGAAREFKVRIG